MSNNYTDDAKVFKAFATGIGCRYSKCLGAARNAPVSC